MAHKNSRNTDILKDCRSTTSPKIYSIILKLVNDGREDLAEVVLKIDYLLEYTSKCIKDKDYKEARNVIKMIDERIHKIKKENYSIDYIDHIYSGIKKKIK